MNQSFAPESADRFEAALRRFDQENAQDPHLVERDGTPQPRELVYAQWLSEWVLRLNPDASEALRLAARSAHLRRWTIERRSYPETRAGYLRWRTDLKRFHSQEAGKILQGLAYPASTIEKVQGLVSKSSFPNEPDSRTLEDALCLVFLEHQFAELAKKSGPEKVINALQKTWQKMTPAAREIALGLNYTPTEKMILERALQPT